MPKKRPWRAILWPLCCFLLAGLAGSGCDLQTKAWAEQALGGAAGKSMTIIEPWLELSLHYNRGTAFSLVGDLGTTRTVMGVFAMVMVVGLLLLVLFSRVRPFEAMALGLLAAGAFGNGFDRLARLAPGGGTGVVDFVKVNYPWGGSWPTFNVADALLVVGVAAFVVDQLLARRRAGSAGPAPESPAGA